MLPAFVKFSARKNIHVMFTKKKVNKAYKKHVTVFSADDANAFIFPILSSINFYTHK